MKALIVIDQPELRDFVANSVRDVGYEPELADSTSAALQVYQPQIHGLVITSWKTNNVDGEMVCRNIRQLDSQHCTLILIVTEGRPVAEIHAALEAGADDYIKSTLDVDLLRIRLLIAAQRARNRFSSALIEQRLRESNERFELAVAGANDGLWDAEAREMPWFRPDAKVWYSRRYKELLGYTDEEFPDVLESWLSHLHPDDRDGVFAAVSEHIQHQRRYDVEYRLRTKSGEYRWFSARGLGIWDRKGQLMRMSGSLRDITDIKQYEAKLEQSEATWRSLVEHAPDIILLADADGTIKFVNRHTEIATTSIGRSMYDYVEEPYKEPMRAALEAVRTTGQPQRFEVRGQSEHGNTGVWYANRLGPIWTNNRIESVILIGTDITRRKLAEERLHLEQQMLRRLLDFQERERRVVAYDIHDGLVQYLTGALMHLEASEVSHPGIPPESKADYERGLSLLREALSEGRRLISGLRPPILDEKGVVAALEYLLSEARTYIPDIKFVNSTHFGRLAPTLEAAIFRIAQEALTNIRLHSGAKRAQMELLQNGEQVRLVVRDWGQGFDLTKVPEDSFGLQGIRERTRLLGTSALIESSPGKGTVITVDFPLIPEKRVAAGEPLPAAK